MLSTRQNRLDPSEIDRKVLDQLVAALSQPGHATLIDPVGQRTELPEPVYQHLLRVLEMMRKGRAIIMLPEDETFTTQAAANYLGVSRQHLVDLLERGEIPFHKVGSHRRVHFKDLLKYEKSRDHERRSTLDRLAQQVEAAGKYESHYTGNE
ncbi:MAG: helix-turn-helix domain-containing protein [Opitutales bacterium]|nr:helix-turn-helix domain-containing protein [Opitutales bacterium]